MRMFAMITTLLSSLAAEAQEWRQLPSLPDREGFAAPFAGVSHGTLLVAGGANFPDKKPWEGGQKVWYDTVFVLDRPEGEWQVAGRLPKPLGYGVCVTYRESMLCVGGSDAQQHYADAFQLEYKEGQLQISSFPSLPISLANACGALVGDVLYVAGGQERPDSLSTVKRVWRINLAAKELQWEELPPWPGSGRMLAVAAAADGAFWLIGGVDLKSGVDGKPHREYLRDAYYYQEVAGWQRVADLPCPVVAAPSPAPISSAGIYVLGGDDGSQVGVAPDQHQGFSKRILRYDVQSGAWTKSGEVKAPRVTVPCVLWHESWVIPSGEMRPGIRSPEVWSYRLQ